MFTRYFEANISEHPLVEPGHHPAEITLGDMHGNVLRLIYSLIAEGAITLETPEDYESLFAIYMDPMWDEPVEKWSDHVEYLLAEFQRITSKIKVNPPFSFLRLIGDEVSDRGTSDLLTLSFLDTLEEKMKRSDPQAKIQALLSNHSADFIHCQRPKEYGPYAPKVKDEGNARRSYYNYVKAIEYFKNKDSNFIKDKVIKPYINHLNRIDLFSYKIDEANNTFYLFTHAPVGRETIIGLAKLYEVPFQDKTMQQLGATMDAINKKFRERPFDFIEHPMIQRLIWRRGYEDDEPEFDLPDVPDETCSYGFVGIHGHESELVVKGQYHIPFYSWYSNMLNLDSDFAKFMKETFVGNYLSIISFQASPKEQKVSELKTKDLSTSLKVSARLQVAPDKKLSIIKPVPTVADAIKIMQAEEKEKARLQSQRIAEEVQAKIKKDDEMRWLGRLHEFITAREREGDLTHCFSLTASSKDLEVARHMFDYYDFAKGTIQGVRPFNQKEIERIYKNKYLKSIVKNLGKSVNFNSLIAPLNKLDEKEKARRKSKSKTATIHPEPDDTSDEKKAEPSKHQKRKLV